MIPYWSNGISWPAFVMSKNGNFSLRSVIYIITKLEFYLVKKMPHLEMVLEEVNIFFKPIFGVKEYDRIASLVTTIFCWVRWKKIQISCIYFHSQQRKRGNFGRKQRWWFVIIKIMIIYVLCFMILC